MSITIKKYLDPKDYNSVIDFALDGLHLSDYCQGIDLYLFSRLSVYKELLKATRIYSVYENDKFIGVLLAEIKGEQKKIDSFWMKAFVKGCEILYSILEGPRGYYQAIKLMYDEYIKINDPYAEILLFVLDPKMKGKGIGTMLLKEFEKDLKDKEVFLYADIGCTYQFYEHRGYTKEQEIEYFEDSRGELIKCFLYSKKIK